MKQTAMRACLALATGLGVGTCVARPVAEPTDIPRTESRSARGAREHTRGEPGAANPMAATSSNPRRMLRLAQAPAAENDKAGDSAMSLQTLVESMPAPGSSEHPRNTEASMVVRKDGSYLLAYTEFYGGGADDAGANIVGLVSRDGGKTWGERRILQENIGGCNVMSPALLSLQDGGMLLAFIRKDSHESCTIFARRSEDQGRTFGDPVTVNDWTAYMGIVNDSLLQLENGRIVCPVYYSQAPCWTPKEHYVARMCISDDGGRTWRHATHEVDCPKRGAMEPVVVQRSDGSLLMLIRTQMGRVYQSVSEDAGDTWTEAEPSVLPSQEAPITARMIPDADKLLLVWNAGYDAKARSHGGRRSPLHVAVADPALARPPALLALESSDKATFSYASIAFTNDRVLLTYYVGQDHALVGGKRKTFLGLRFRALDLGALLGRRE